MSGWLVFIWTVVIIACSAFFVAIEFATMSAKRYRLEADALTSSAARAALRNSAELTLVLAGSQLGITVCTLALGAITEPAVHHALIPLLDWTGLPETVSQVTAFVLALLLVTFLHLVIGEMAPKSWTITNPERVAILLSLPMRGFITITRPLLRGLNVAANWLVRRVGVEPVDEISPGLDHDSLRQLVEHSANVGALAASYSSSLANALDFRDLTLADVLPSGQIAAVSADATIAHVQAVSQQTGHRRILLRDGSRTVGLVHVRDTLSQSDTTTPAAPLAREPYRLPSSTRLRKAVMHMQRTSNHLVVVTDGERELGLVSITDILPRLFPALPDEQHS